MRFGLRELNISYFRVFHSKCFILDTKQNLGRFDAKFDDSIFLTYSTTNKTYLVYNRRILTIQEPMHVLFLLI